ncbi:MAG: TadE family protein [Myxococcota bacterium]
MSQSRRATRGERGQALVETAIIMPVMIFATLGALQLMLVQHGRIMTEYAAYCAARAGIVHNADWNVMRNAALVATLPLYDRTDDAERYLSTWAKVKAAAEITEAVDTGTATLERVAGDLLGVEISGTTQDVSLVEVAVTRPTRDEFRAVEAWAAQQARDSQVVDPTAPLRYPDGEVDFDDVLMFADPNMPDGLGTLALEVRVLYPLKIPLVNKVVFELWLAQELLRSRTFDSSLGDWVQFRTKISDGGGAGQYLSDAVSAGEGEGPLDDFFTTSQWMKEVRTLRWVAQQHDLYLLPLRSSYAMQMQSNLFEDNQREPVWFTLGEGS